MADDQIPTPEPGTQPLAPLVQDLVERTFDVKKLSRVERLITNALQTAAATTVGLVLSLAAKIGAFLGKTILEAENQAQPEFNELARVALLDMFGVDVGSVSATRGRGGNRDAADAIGDMMLRAFSGQARAGAGDGDTIEPSDAPAKAFLSAMAQMSLEGWLEGWLVESLTLGQIETFGDLDDTISHVLGLGRASASVHGPLVRHMIVDPLERKILREHRPTELGASTVARQWFRGRWDWADVQEALARQGHSDENIDALLSEARRYISADDVAVLARRIGDSGGSAGGMFSASTFDARQYLREMGFDGDDAALHLLAAETRIIDTQERQLADACIQSYVRGDINAIEYRRFIAKISLPAGDLAHLLKLGDLRRELNRAQLSDSDAQAAVRKQIVTFAWYRGYLADLGFDDAAIAIKEQLLRGEIDKAASAEKLRVDTAAARAADKAAADAARAQRIAAAAIAGALPTYGEVRRAFVRGLVDAARLADAINAAHPNIAPADAAALLADAQLDAATYQRQLAARDAAIARDSDKGLPLATLEDSVLRGINSIDTFDRELRRRGFNDADRATLVALLRGRQADQAAASHARQAAAAAATLRAVSLSDFERAVRLGLRTRDAYAAFLAQLPIPDVQRGLILDLLDADLARDDDAAAKRADVDAAAAARAINLPLRRRAYVNGIEPREQYVQDLSDAGVAPENAELELQLADLEYEHRAAQLARAGTIEHDQAAADQARPPKTLTLAQLERAVKLGLLEPNDLRDALRARQYGDADVELLVASVLADLPTLKQAEQLQDVAAGELRAKGVSLGDLRQSVAKGLLTLDQFAGELAARGFGVDAIALLRELLAEQTAIGLDSLRTKIAAALAGVDGAPSVADLESAIATRQASDAALTLYLTTNGVARDVALVYVRLIHSFAAAPAPGAQS